MILMDCLSRADQRQCAMYVLVVSGVGCHGVCCVDFIVMHSEEIYHAGYLRYVLCRVLVRVGRGKCKIMNSVILANQTEHLQVDSWTSSAHSGSKRQLNNCMLLIGGVYL